MTKHTERLPSHTHTQIPPCFIRLRGLFTFAEREAPKVFSGDTADINIHKKKLKPNIWWKQGPAPASSTAMHCHGQRTRSMQPISALKRLFCNSSPTIHPREHQLGDTQQRKASQALLKQVEHSSLSHTHIVCENLVGRALGIKSRSLCTLGQLWERLAKCLPAKCLHGKKKIFST